MSHLQELMKFFASCRWVVFAFSHSSDWVKDRIIAFIKNIKNNACPFWLFEFAEQNQQHGARLVSVCRENITVVKNTK